jgi:predicted MFS family arabinose efflux permease
MVSKGARRPIKNMAAIAQASAKRTTGWLFYGWRVVAASAVALFFGPIPLNVFSFGVFLQPWAREFHATRAAISLARALLTVVLPLGLPFAGRLVDRYGVRRVALPCAILAGLTMLSANLTVGSLRQLYIFYLVLGLAVCGAGPLQYSDAVSRWFDRQRGLALGLAMLGLGLGALVTPLAAQYLIARMGCRGTLSVFGALGLVITVPAIALCLKDPPEDARGPRRAAPGLSWKGALRTRTFWAMFASFTLVASSVQACLSHIASILADRGSGAPAAALATSLLGGGVLIGRVGSGYFLDRFFAPRVAGSIFGLAALGTGLLRIAGSGGVAGAAAFSIGLGLGAEVDIMAFLAGRYFGLRAFGTIYGILFGGFGLAGGIGTYLMGASYDATSSYAFAVDISCLAAAIGGVIIMCLGPYPYHSQHDSYAGGH